MPTGSGKSLCYQLPTVIMGSTVVVISLISLMQESGHELDQLGIRAAILNSSLTAAEHAQVVRRAIWGAYRVLYLSPGRLALAGYGRLAHKSARCLRCHR
jgi:ATP-dependent DNA helicase RecQ